MTELYAGDEAVDDRYAGPTVTQVDATGDGVADVVAVDDTGDGQADFVLADETGDGLVDHVLVPGDAATIDNGEPSEEGFDVLATEPVITSVDTSGDGLTDLIAVDDTGDGRADFTLVDDTGDGLIDRVVVPGETLTIDNTGALADDDTGPSVDFELPNLPGTVLDAEPAIDAAPSPPVGDETVSGGDELVGDPTEAADEWFWQAADGFCVPAALAQVVSEFTGDPVTDLGVAAVAEELGHFSADGGGEFSGMTSEGALETLEAMGVPARLEYAPDDDPFSALTAHLEAGRAVIIAVDSEEVWDGVDDDSSDGAADANHVVVVTGVDTENGVVYLNDPGHPDGQAMEVPLSGLEDAWADSDYEMLVTDAPSPDAVGADEAALDATAANGVVLLPVVLAREVLS